MFKTISENVEFNFNNLKKWRKRYSLNEYPYIVVKNMFYDLVTLEMIESEIFDCIKYGKQFNSFEESSFYIFNTFRREQLSILNLMDDYLSNDIKIIDCHSINFKQLIDKARLGHNNSVEEIEYFYISRVSLKALFILWASFVLNGFSQIDAYKKIFPNETTDNISTKIFTNLETILNTFRYNIDSIMCDYPIGSNNESIKPIYSPLPKLWNNKIQHDQDKTYFDKETIYRSVSFSPNTIYNYPLVCIELSFFQDISKIYIYDIGFDPPYYDLSGFGNELDILKVRRGNGFEGVRRRLRLSHIYVSEWKKVNIPLYMELPHMMAN